ncbi:MAG: 50S ribosomal protein L21 [Bacteroidales bacterium]
MYAIVEIAGQQFKVEEGKKIFVHRLEVEEGKEILFERVLLIEDEGKVTIGEPTIKNAVVGGKILDHMRGDKVIVFKKKRKKGYRVKNGHRQNLTQVEIISINGKSSPKKAAPKKEEAKVAEVKVAEEPAKNKKAVKKPTIKKEEAPSKKASAKKVTVKKPAEKKPAAKKTTKSKE